ncbi:MAG TPA: hypothetical protein VEC11_07840 [Allosphingosinicella sp.]|nr:hypothetical protein [Allosphingosinicella sp.]
MNFEHPAASYIATLAAIVILCIVGALVVVLSPADTDVALARLIGALAFIGTGVTGLIGVISAFRPRSPNPGPARQDANQQQEQL